MAIQVKGISLVQGSRDFRVCGVQIKLAGPTPNNTLPLVDAPAAVGGNTLLALRHGIHLGNRGVK